MTSYCKKIALLAAFCAPCIGFAQLKTEQLDNKETLSPVNFAKFQVQRDVLAQKAGLEIARISMDLGEHSEKVI